MLKSANTVSLFKKHANRNLEIAIVKSKFQTLQSANLQNQTISYIFTSRKLKKKAKSKANNNKNNNNNNYLVEEAGDSGSESMNLLNGKKKKEAILSFQGNHGGRNRGDSTTAR